MSTPKYRKLPVGSLFVDGRYQRDLRPQRVKAIAKAFDAAQLGVLEVSVRDDDTYVVFDGQHRLAALRTLGAESAPCLIHAGLSAEDEAALFARLQLDRRGLSSLERFKAQVFAGVPHAVAVAAIADEVGLTIGKRGVRAVAALERIYRREGEARLAETLATARDLWNGDKRATDGYLLEGLAQFLTSYGDRLGAEQMDRLAAASPTTILRRSLGSMQGGGGHARHAVDAELRKVAGVRGRPRTKTAAPVLELVKAA